MKKRLQGLAMLLGVTWGLDGGTVLARELQYLQLSASQNAPKVNATAFEHVHALAMDAAGKVIFLGTHVSPFRSDDGGRSWKKVTLSAKLPSFDVLAVTPDPKDSRTIYVATHEAGVFKSTDGGMTWKESNTGLGGLDVHGLAIDPNDGKLHALVREKGAGIYRSTNGGEKWTRVDDGPGGEVKVLMSVSIPTGMGGIFLYAGTGEGLRRSPDCF